MFRKTVKYDDLETLRGLLVGQTIESVTKSNAGWTDYTDPSGSVVICLSNGVELEALEAEGCGGCINGWWTVGSEAVAGATIMNLSLEEHYTANGVPVTDRGTHWPQEQDSMVKIILFALTEAGDEMGLVTSYGQDNGSYGWGFHFKVGLPSLRLN